MTDKRTLTAGELTVHMKSTDGDIEQIILYIGNERAEFVGDEIFHLALLIFQLQDAIDQHVSNYEEL